MAEITGSNPIRSAPVSKPALQTTPKTTPKTTPAEVSSPGPEVSGLSKAIKSEAIFGGLSSFAGKNEPMPADATYAKITPPPKPKIKIDVPGYSEPEEPTHPEFRPASQFPINNPAQPGGFKSKNPFCPAGMENDPRFHEIPNSEAGPLFWAAYGLTGGEGK